MKVFQTDHEGFLVGEAIADPDPLDNGNWLIPGGCVKNEPPALSNGQRAQFVDGAWVVIDPEPAPEPEHELPPTKEKIEQTRRDAYAQEADPVFFMSQRGEATEADWLAKIVEIKVRYPYPAE